MNWLEKLVYTFNPTRKIKGSYYCFIYLLREIKRKKGLLGYLSENRWDKMFSIL